MKTKFHLTLVFFFLMLPFNIHAGGESGDECSTKYPVILAHGMAASAEILGIVDYWWGIEDVLEDRGADVYITSVNGMDGTVEKAEEFKRQFLEILAATGKEKANIIGHSHGTIYTRYAISNLGIGDKVASYTSISGPHQGSSIADMLYYGIPDQYQGLMAEAMDFLYKNVFGDDNPDTYKNIANLTTVYMKNIFNPNTPDVPGIYYQSYTSRAKIACPNAVLTPTWLILLEQEGENDGLVSVESSKWGSFKGVQEGEWWSPGVDHMNIIGQLLGFTPGFDAPEFFSDIVKDLKSDGF